MFIVSLSYKTDLVEVDRHLDAHVAYLNEHYQRKHFVLSGRKVPRTGGIILVDVATRAELDAIISDDPFYLADVAEYQIIEFLPTMAAKGLEHLVP